MNNSIGKPAPGTTTKTEPAKTEDAGALEAAAKAKEAAEVGAEDVSLLQAAGGALVDAWRVVPGVGLVIDANTSTLKTLVDWSNGEGIDVRAHLPDVGAMKPGDVVEIKRTVSVKESGGSIDDAAKITVTRTKSGTFEVKTELGSGVGSSFASNQKNGDGDALLKGKVGLSGEVSQTRTFTSVAEVEAYLVGASVSSAYLPASMASMVDSVLPGGEVTSVGFKLKFDVEASLPVAEKAKQLNGAMGALGLSLKAANDSGARVDVGPPPAVVLSASVSGEEAVKATGQLLKGGATMGVGSPLAKAKTTVTVEQAFPLAPGWTMERAMADPKGALEAATSPGVTRASVKGELAPATGSGLSFEVKAEHGADGWQAKSAKTTTFRNEATDVELKLDLGELKGSLVERQQLTERNWDGKSDVGTFVKSAASALVDVKTLVAQRG